MKKTILTSCLGMLISGALFAQPVSDRAVVPVAVTLNQILRIHVLNGGNVEFVFNTIDQYKVGIANSSFYNTDFVVASSTDWELGFGAEDATLMGVDMDNQGAGVQRTMPRNNVGFTITATGVYQFGAEHTLNNNADVTANALGQFGVTASQNPMISPGTGNGGDIQDNAFTIAWECGTMVAGGTLPMNATTLLSQNLTPDRYVTNVLMDINSL